MSLTGIITSPILSQIDLSIMDYLQRKLSPDIFSNHMYNDIRILEMLQQMGVQFTVPHTVLIKSLQYFFISLFIFIFLRFLLLFHYCYKDCLGHFLLNHKKHFLHLAIYHFYNIAFQDDNKSHHKNY